MTIKTTIPVLLCFFLIFNTIKPMQNNKELQLILNSITNNTGKRILLSIDDKKILAPIGGFKTVGIFKGSSGEQIQSPKFLLNPIYDIEPYGKYYQANDIKIYLEENKGRFDLIGKITFSSLVSSLDGNLFMISMNANIDILNKNIKFEAPVLDDVTYQKKLSYKIDIDFQNPLEDSTIEFHTLY